MRKAILLTLAFVSVAFADEGFQIIHVDDLAKLLAKPPANFFVYDANPTSVRERDGVIPGAKLLPPLTEFDTSDELPAAKDAKLVFYCANPH